MNVDVYKIISDDKPLEFVKEVKLDPNKYHFSYPLVSINKCTVRVRALKNTDDYVAIFLYVEANVTLVCSYLVKPFDKDISGREYLFFTSVKENCKNNDELIYYKGNKIEIDDYIYETIISNIPTSPIAPDATFPSSGPGYRVLTEDELNEEEKNKGNDKFDILDDIDLD